MASVLVREETQTQDIQREDGHVKTEAEIRVMLLQTKEHLGFPKAGRDKEGSTP